MSVGMCIVYVFFWSITRLVNQLKLLTDFNQNFLIIEKPLYSAVFAA